MKPPLLRRFLRAVLISRFSVLSLGVVLTAAAGATPPVITSPSTLDVYYNPEDRGGYLFSYRIQATNTPTSYGATPLAPNLTVDATTGILLGDPSRPGIYALTITASNAEGTAAAPLQIRVHPAAMGVQSTPGTYYTGDSIRYSIMFNAPVVVTGLPYIEAHGRAVYASGSGTSTLVFVHTVAPTDVPIEEVYLGSLVLNGGTMRSVDSLDAGLVLPLRFFRSGVRIGPNPTVLSETRAGEVGSTFSYAAQTSFASLQPVYTAVPLPPGLTLNSSTSIISGTPTTAGTYNVVLTATAPGGSPRASGTLTLVITTANVSPPPPPPLPPPPPPPPPAGPVAQTIALAAAGPVVVGQPVQLTATASSGLPVTLALLSGQATLTGTSLTVADTGLVVVRATQAGNSAFLPAATELSLSAMRAAQTLEFVSPVSAIVIGQPIRLSANASSGLPVRFSVVSGNATMAGDALTVTGPGPVVVRATQPGSGVFNPTSMDLTITGAVRAAQVLSVPLANDAVLSDRPITVTASASSGLPVSVEIVSGPAVLNGNVLVPTAASGAVTFRARQTGNDVYAPTEMTRTLTIVPAGRLVNLSARVRVQEGDASRSFIAGFVVTGPSPKRMVLRAVGPALSGFGVQAPLANPLLRVYDQNGRVLMENDDWSGADMRAAFVRLGAFALAPASKDAALLATLPPGAYTLQVVAQGGEGVALVEIYDASEVPALELQQVINLSTRALVGTGEAVLAAGFVVTGSVPKRVLVRGVGPGLSGFGVTGVLEDPALRIFQGGSVIAQNDDWQTPTTVSAVQSAATGAELAAAAAATGAFALQDGSRDAGLIVVLSPGAYTAIVNGVNETTGAGMVEVYELPER